MHWIKTIFKVLVIHGLSRNISHYRRIFAYSFCLISLCFLFSDQPIKINSECQKSITISVVCENLSLIYQNISDKFYLKKSKLLKKIYGFLMSLPPSNFAVFSGSYFLCCCSQRAKINTNC